MTIDELINYVTKRNEQALTPGKVVQERFLFRFKTGHNQTASTFFNTSYQSFSEFSDSENTIWNTFIVKYTCYMISHYEGLKMNEAVANCSLDDNILPLIKNQSALFGKIALDAYLHLHDGIEDYVKSTEFLETIKSKPFFNLHKSDSDHEALKLLLFLCKTRYDNSQTSVFEQWKKFDQDFCEKFSIDAYISYAWIELIKNELPAGQALYNALNGQVRNACSETRTVHSMVKKGVMAGRNMITREVPCTEWYYAEHVISWLKETADGYKCYANKPISYHSDWPGSGDDADAGCVLAGTKIMMSNLQQKSIEEIQCNDTVLNCREHTSYCSDEIICNPFVRKLYAINDDEPFMSLEHAILSERGWCAVDPCLANKINPFFEVKALEIGDIIQKYEVVNDCLVKHSVVVEKITIKDNIESTICYDLHFYDGEQSYIANGYPCLLNYPTITIAGIKRKLYSMDKIAQSEIIAQLIENKHMVEVFLGEGQTKILFNELLSLNDMQTDVKKGDSL